MYHRITLLHTGNEHNIVNQLYSNTITKKAKSLISVLDLRCPFERRHGTNLIYQELKLNYRSSTVMLAVTFYSWTTKAVMNFIKEFMVCVGFL